MQKLINFEINDIKIERLLDDSTALCEFRIIDDGPNKHSIGLTIDVIKDAAERTLRGKPILATYSDWKNDLEGHKPPDQSEPIGYFIENQEFSYKPVEDGKTALFAKGLLWKKYASKQVNAILDSENHSKSVSMEIEITSFVDESDSNPMVKSYDFRSVVVLGRGYPPASERAFITMLTFSEMKEKYEMMFVMDSMKINNSEKAAIKSSSWRNLGRIFYSKLMEQSNVKSLIKEAYLVVESGWEEHPSESLKFPHHSIKDGELVLNVAGCQAALQRAKQVNLSGEALEHLKRHYKELNLDVSNFSTNLKEKEESKLEEKVMMEEPKEEEKFEDEKPEPETKPEGEIEEKEEDKKEEEDFALKYSETAKRLEEYTAKFAEQEEELNALRKYKADKEESEKNYAIEQTMAEVNEYLPKDEAEKFRAEAAEVKFSEVEAFKNKIKARSLDFAKTSQVATNRMAIVRDNEEKKDKWGW